MIPENEMQRMDSPHISVETEIKGSSERVVQFAEDVDVYEVESFRPWLPTYWYRVSNTDQMIARILPLIAHVRMPA